MSRTDETLGQTITRQDAEIRSLQSQVEVLTDKTTGARLARFLWTFLTGSAVFVAVVLITFLVAPVTAKLADLFDYLT